MSKCGGGGGLKSHDKGGSGSVKLVKKHQSLEAALDKVPDAILCPEGHRMKLHTGSKREGPLTCDGPDYRCCGKDGDGILYPGVDQRYSCIECDFDICEACMEYETKPAMSPEEEKEAARQRLREKLGRGGGGNTAAAQAKASAEEEAKALAAKRAEIEKRVAEAKARAAVMALTEGTNAEPKTEAVPANDDSDAATAAKKAKAARKRAAQKARKAAGGATPTAAEEAEEAAEEEPAAGAAAPLADATAATVTPQSPAPTTQPVFSFNWNLSTPPAKGQAMAADSSDESDESDDEEEVAAPRAESALAEAALTEKGLLNPPETPLCCPFTRQVMKDPVILADGHTYERTAAQAYLQKFDHSPRTGEKLSHKSVLPNLMARELCACALQLEL